MLEVKETREDIDNTTVVLLVEAVNDYMACGEEGDEDMALLNFLCHIAGYCGKSAAKKRMCPPCTALLVKDDNGGELRQIQLDEEQERVSLSDAVLVASRQFTKMLNRGKLTKPSDFCLNIVREICFMWRALVCTEETRLLLLHANSSCEVFVRVVTQVFVDDGQLHDTKCEAGHDFVGAVVPSLARALFNTFTSNYVKERNSEIHSSKHGSPLYPVMTRDRKKLAKLQGRKPKQFTEILNRGKLTKPSDFCDAVLVASRQFTEILNHGKLTKPSDFCLNVVREICFMCTEETRLLLLQANSSCEVFVRVVTQVFVVGVQNFQCPACRRKKQGRRGEKNVDCKMRNTKNI
ncbi:hypothetical protein GWK47_012673 [Chionoecetes opilio]|uniref:Uncharacterized protein n=1 Tax=Chionoecetes opilio TaxID=41210 RepID=A0A8J5CPB7_CHIOP|nr:hypothetical protein GWK47_012673 [Chionoecetes opilio]